jgi:hypothetical protein
VLAERLKLNDRQLQYILGELAAVLIVHIEDELAIDEDGIFENGWLPGIMNLYTVEDNAPQLRVVQADGSSRCEYPSRLIGLSNVVVMAEEVPRGSLISRACLIAQCKTWRSSTWRNLHLVMREHCSWYRLLDNLGRIGPFSDDLYEAKSSATPNAEEVFFAASTKRLPEFSTSF